MIFAGGTAAGLAGAWWLDRQAGMPAVAVQPSAAGAAHPAQLVRKAPHSARTGIPLSELPYDGKPPPVEYDPSIDATPVRPVARSSAAAKPSTTATQTAAARTEAPNRKRALDGGTQATEHTLRDAKLEEQREATKKATPSASSAENKDAGSPAPIASPGAARIAAPAKAQRSSQPENQAAQATSRTSRKAVKDREIERMREEAAQELKKKSEQRRLTRETRAREQQQVSARSSSPTGNRRAMLERCARVPSLIGREMCKWEACNGMWGKDGCPSYDKPASVF